MSAYDLNALSGINAMSQGLSVVSNNLANAQSMGFKSSRAEFADMFSGAQTTPGNGVRVNSITQDFSQGTITATGRELDMAIDGDGFFILEDKSGKYSNLYTRNGSFKLDKEGFITDQMGNNLLGFNLNAELSNEMNAVFDTALKPINLADLNRTPKATDEMTYNINLNGEQLANTDPTRINNGNDLDDDSVGATENLQSLFGLQGVNAYQGFPDFIYPKPIHDSLGGEHTLNSNFYKRDVVPADISDIDAEGNDPAVSLQPAVKYTSWLVQYEIVDRDGNRTAEIANQATGNAIDGVTSQVYELRFNTNGELIGIWQPVDYAAGTSLDGATAIATDADFAPLIAGVANSNVDPAVAAQNLAFERVSGTRPSLNFVVNNPLTGATDPLGGPIQGTTPTQFNIAVDFDDMTQFAGDYLLRGVTQNGYKIGDLVGLTTNREGVIEARYSNGRSIPVAQLALGNFNDLNALEKLGGQMYAESFGSGPVQISKAGSGVVGAIQAGSLEYSNVDTAGELVKMIQLQRTYQASAQVISTSQELTRTILNL
ncbi:flagellar hook protein FlgE [Thiomicrospira microaerophila]|uniref:flagellar hook protein FlgE n=1 Tax=Thiomicrospira microaerophila TaxID=406020 RepID=UPI00200C8785|nr:flagellar hook protein FlgE [Thiomicrospira microaerophila]